MTHLPPGKYYIGDPCYVFGDDTWQRLLDAAEEGRADSALHVGDVVEFEGHKVWSHSTMNGDGEYEDQNGVKYCVDSGTIGVVPIELIDDPAGEEDGGLVIDCPNGLNVEYDNGTFWLGPVCIKTNENLDRDFDDDQVDGDYGRPDMFFPL